MSWKALVGRCGKEHGNQNEYKKCVFWEAQRLPALPLPTVRKRNMTASATSAILYSRTGGDNEPEERTEEACAVCSRKGWLEQLPDAKGDELAEEFSGEDKSQGGQTRRMYLRDADIIYYFGDAAKINQYLGVEHYAKSMPRIP